MSFSHLSWQLPPGGRVIAGERVVERILTRRENYILHHADIVIVGLELVDDRGHDPAFALGRVDIGVAAIFGLARAEEALDDERGAIVLRAAACGEEEGEG